ncbi:MAG: ATP-binding protein, partial [Pseudomonadota bacterium]
ITIEDNGPGILEERRRAALEAGKRLDVATPGTGLGLAIANDLMHAYGGDLTLARSPELGGLKVILTLPQARKGFAPPPRVEAA